MWLQLTAVMHQSMVVGVDEKSGMMYCRYPATGGRPMSFYLLHWYILLVSTEKMDRMVVQQ
jgi:hypothetical protein